MKPPSRLTTHPAQPNCRINPQQRVYRLQTHFTFLRVLQSQLTTLRPTTTSLPEIPSRPHTCQAMFQAKLADPHMFLLQSVTTNQPLPLRHHGQQSQVLTTVMICPPTMVKLMFNSKASLEVVTSNKDSLALKDLEDNSEETTFNKDSLVVANCLQDQGSIHPKRSHLVTVPCTLQHLPLLPSHHSNLSLSTLIFQHCPW